MKHEVVKNCSWNTSSQLEKMMRAVTDYKIGGKASCQLNNPGWHASTRPSTDTHGMQHLGVTHSQTTNSSQTESLLHTTTDSSGL